MQVTRIDSYKHYGAVLSVTEGKLTLYVTLDCGPRIIYASYDGSDNLFYNGDVTLNKPPYEDVFGAGSRWNLYGGHRFWIAPETYPYTYYPDNEPVKYEVGQNTVTFTPPPQRVVDVQEKMTLTFAFGGIAVTHTLKNVGDKAKLCAAWAITALAEEAAVKVPFARQDTDSYAPNRGLAFWPYSDLGDLRFWMESDAVCLRHDKKITEKFKVGCRNTAGRIAIHVGDILFNKGYKSKHDVSAYTDLGVSTEMFVNGAYIEVETLGPLTQLNPGESTHHTEYWTFTKM